MKNTKYFFLIMMMISTLCLWGTYSGEGTFEKITTISELESGAYYVFYGSDGAYTGAMSNILSSNVLGNTTVNVTDNSITDPSINNVWLVEGSSTSGYTVRSSGIDNKYAEITRNDNAGFTLNASSSHTYDVSYNNGDTKGFLFKCKSGSGLNRGIGIRSPYNWRTYIANTDLRKNLDLYKLTTPATPQVSTPTFNPVAGTYYVTQNVEISCATTGAAIYYTLDGTSPTTSSTIYTAALEINATTTVKAIGVKAGNTDSAIAEAIYTITAPPALVADFSANSTTVYVDQVVTLTNSTSGGATPYSYSWTFGDSGTSTDENPTHAYTAIGTYTITLTVTDGNNDTDAETKTNYIIVEAAPEGATDLFISEYCEPFGGNTKYIEIFNGTGTPVDLSDYYIGKITNGGTWSEDTLALSGTLANNDVFVIANSNSDAAVLLEVDVRNNTICEFNGNDAIGLFIVEGLVGTLIDAVGTDGTDPGTGWDVAGVTNATKDHTLVRKSSVFEGNTDWDTSRGTSTENSEWIVEDVNTYTYVGSHVFTFEAETEFGVDFSADITSGDPSLTVAFTSTVYGGTTPYTYSWDFDGDDSEDSTSANPSYTYTEAGVYTVSLYVTDNASADSTVVKTAYITVNDTSVEGYYSTITETTGSALKAQLATLISTNTSTDYDASREQMYSVIDNINDTVTGIYSGLAVSHTYGTTTTPTGIDCEHSYPQSWLEAYESAGDFAMARADIHHLFPTKSQVNSSRGNRPFDYVNSVTTSWSEATGYVSYTGENVANDDVFEVADQHKGNTARAMLYMNTRWALTLSDDGSTTGLTIDMLPTLLQWCASDPVDQAEIDRNQAIFAYQGNRNPFVDYPNWITAIYGSATATQVTTPIITPTSGNYTNSAQISISSATSGATIYYTTDGTTPTESSSQYANPFTITESKTIKAYAVKASFDDSEVATATYTITENQNVATDLFISEYAEGSTGNNKALEIYNGTGSDIDFSVTPYSVQIGSNGGDWGSSIALTGRILANSVYVVAHTSADELGITGVVNLSSGSLGFNGNDAVGLFNDTVLIDVIGLYQNDPGTDKGWDVAGTTEATKDYVIVRKAHIAVGNTNWTTSAGTDASDSEWSVYPDRTYDYLGTHTFAPLSVDFSADLTSTTVGTTITFTPVVTGGVAGYAYEWDFDNDGIVDSEITTPSHIYNQAGTYSVSLYVVDNNLDERTVIKANYITVESNMTYTGDLIISEYLSGTGNNKSVELYNGTGQTVDLSDYSIQIATAGGSWTTTIALSGNLANDDVYVVSHLNAGAAIYDQSDLRTTDLNFTGKQAVGLFKSTTALDIVGVPGSEPSGNGWTVAGVVNATYNRTIVRKNHISAGNTDSAEWTGTKAGETTPGSEWIVFPEDVATNLGNHDYDFGDNTLPVTLTSFTSTITYSGLGEPFVSIQWKTEAESGLIGYNILRSEFSNLETAIRTNQEIVGATNSLIGNNYSYVDEQVDLYSTYYYWLESVELSNENETFGPISIRVENNNSNGVTIPYQTTLRGVYPNPFNPTTTVSFYVKNPDRVKIKVYNIKGQEIKELDNNVYQPGFHKINWNGKDGNGNDCASGIYFFRMETRSENQTIKGILMK